jgi:hypothetical protein
MRALLAILGFTIIAGANAHAEYQTKECGVNFAQVQKIIDSHDDWKLPDNWASRFIGNWGQDGSIKIETHAAFSYQNYRFKACPQSNGLIVIINLDDPSYVGTLRIRGRNAIVVAGFTGMASMANNTYPRQGASAVATGHGGNDF